MAIGNEELESIISEIPDVQTESNSNIDIISDILTYETYDFVILNSLLSERKAVKAVSEIHDLDSIDKPKIIVLIKDLIDKKFIAQMVGMEVTAFVPFDRIPLIERYIRDYPASFDLSLLAESDKTLKTMHTAVTGTVSIGVFGLQSGAGATTAAIKIAEEIANCGHRVLCVEITSANFKKIRKKQRNVEYISAAGNEKDAILQLAYGSNEFPFIVIDFGRMFDVNSDTCIESARQSCIGDFLRCNYKIGLCFASIWNTDQLALFLKNDFFKEDLSRNQLMLLISGEDEEGALKDYHELPIWLRDDFEEFTQDFFQNIGIGIKKVRKKQPFWKRK